MFERLLAYDEGTNLVPLLADGMPTVSADGKTVHVQDPHGRQLRQARTAPSSGR